jgi:aminoglycoside 3-N-acetyltransferase
VITAADIASALRDAGVEPGDTVYAHSSMQAAIRAEGASREGKMDTVLGGFEAAVGDGGVLMLPTFSYSYCRGEDFDVAASTSTVGMLTERFRSRPGVRRTPEPIFSTAVRGDLDPDWEQRLFRVGDVDCFGEDSVFAHLYEVDAKLLFFGVGFEFATYVYLVEERRRVPYRYMKAFTGAVLRDGERTETTAEYFVRHLDQDVENDFQPLAAEMLARGAATETRIPKGPRILVAGARAVHDVAMEGLDDNPDFLLTRGHHQIAR